MEQSLDSILNDDEAPQPEPETAETAPEPEPEAASGPPRDEKGRFAPKGETEPQPEAAAPSATPAPTSEETGLVPRAALQDERRKRQELEAQLEEFRRKAPPAQPPQPAPSIWEDEDGYFNHRLSEVLPTIEERIVARFEERRVAESAQDAREKYEDYDEKIDVFHRLAEADPTLWERLRSNRNPAEFAYSQAKTHLEVSQYGSIEAMVEAKVKEREEALKAELASKLPQSAPPSIATDRSVGARSGPAWSGPSSLSDLLK